MAIVDKLKSLYVKLGGDPNTGASNVEEWIDKIEDVAGPSSGGSSSGSADSDTYYLDLYFVEAKDVLTEEAYNVAPDDVRNQWFVYTDKPKEEYLQAVEDAKRVIVTIPWDADYTFKQDEISYTVPHLNNGIAKYFAGDISIFNVPIYRKHDFTNSAIGIANYRHNINPENVGSEAAKLINKIITVDDLSYYWHSPLSAWNLDDLSIYGGIKVSVESPNEDVENLIGAPSEELYNAIQNGMNVYGAAYNEDENTTYTLQIITCKYNSDNDEYTFYTNYGGEPFVGHTNELPSRAIGGTSV